MSLTGAQKVSLYSLFGLPMNSEALTQYNFTERGQQVEQGVAPSFQTQDLSALQVKVEERIAALDSDQEDRIIAYLVTYDSIVTSPMSVVESPEGNGRLVCHQAEVELIRREVGNVLGFVVPYGGFSQSYIRYAQCNEVIGYR